MKVLSHTENPVASLGQDQGQGQDPSQDQGQDQRQDEDPGTGSSTGVQTFRICHGYSSSCLSVRTHQGSEHFNI